MRSRPRAIHALIALVFATTSGCAAYRVSSSAEVSPSTTPATAATVPVLLAENNLPGRRYIVIGPIEVTIKKLTVFHKNPTKEQANEALIEKARTLGATAVINIKYSSGIGMTSWGVIDAYGTAVRLID